PGVCQHRRARRLWQRGRGAGSPARLRGEGPVPVLAVRHARPPVGDGDVEHPQLPGRYPVGILPPVVRAVTSTSPRIQEWSTIMQPVLSAMFVVPSSTTVGTRGPQSNLVRTEDCTQSITAAAGAVQELRCCAAYVLARIVLCARGMNRAMTLVIVLLGAASCGI